MTQDWENEAVVGEVPDGITPALPTEGIKQPTDSAVRHECDTCEAEIWVSASNLRDHRAGIREHRWMCLQCIVDHTEENDA